MPEPTRPDPPRPPTGRERLRSALTRPSRGQAVVAVLLAALAFAAITQVRSTGVDQEDFTGYREQDLIDVLAGLAGTSQRAVTEIDRLERTRDDLLSDSDSRQAALAQARTEAEALAVLAGTVPVRGPGLRVTVEEVSAQVPPVVLLDMVQELRTGGAEAIQINGQVRLVAQSSFSAGAGGVVVDGQQLQAPYVLDVIGDPHNLENSLTFPLGPRFQVESAGGKLELEDPGTLEIQAVRKPVEPEFAQPAPDE